MKIRISELERRILIYLDSEEPFSTSDGITEGLKEPKDKVIKALRRLEKLKLVRKQDGLYVVTDKILSVVQ